MGNSGAGLSVAAAVLPIVGSAFCLRAHAASWVALSFCSVVRFWRAARVAACLVACLVLLACSSKLGPTNELLNEVRGTDLGPQYPTPVKQASGPRASGAAARPSEIYPGDERSTEPRRL